MYRPPGWFISSRGVVAWNGRGREPVYSSPVYARLKQTDRIGSDRIEIDIKSLLTVIEFVNGCVR